MGRAAAFIVALALLPAHSYAGGRTIHIRHDTGGDVALYRIKAQVATDLGIRIVIDGLCASACTLLTGVPRDQVCVTGRARLHFHRARLARPVKHGGALLREINDAIFENYPPGIRRWIRRHGGLSDRMLKMPPSEVARHFRPCPDYSLGS
jgi:hypothetical protein